MARTMHRWAGGDMFGIDLAIVSALGPLEAMAGPAIGPLQFVDLHLDDSLFMERHRGPLILIVGGSTMLAISLLAFLLHPKRGTPTPIPMVDGPLRRTYPHHAQTHRTASSGHASQDPPPPPLRPASQRRRIHDLRHEAKRAGLGRPRHLITSSGRHALRLKRCWTCDHPRYRGRPCERERLFLENAIQRDIPGARVVEIACANVHRPVARRCLFEILPGGSRT